MTPRIKENLNSVYLAFGLTLILFGFLAGPTRFWTVDLTTVGISGKWFMLPGLVLALVGYWGLRKDRPGLGPKINPFGAALAFPIILVADYFARSYSFFPPESFRGELIVLALFVAWISRHSFEPLLKSILPFAAIVFIAVFFWQSGGNLLLFDDHSAFFYRIQMLKDNFPNIPHYNSWWNAGIDSRDYFATGVINIFLIFAPLIYLFPLEQLYNYLIAATLFILLPCASYFGARILGSEKRVSLLAAFLVMTSGLLWYRWCLKYGAMGFCTSLILLPLNTALTLKLADPDREFSKTEMLIFWFTLVCMSFWPLSALAFLPMIFFALYKIKIIWRKKYSKWLIFGFLAVYLPWAATFMTVSKVGRFLSLGSSSAVSTQVASDGATIAQPQSGYKTDPYGGKMAKLVVKGKSKGLKPREIINHAREVALMTNPLIVFMAIPGFALLTRRAFLPLIALVLWNIALALLVAPLKPQLELERMFLFASFIGALPAALSINYVLERSITRGLPSRIVGVLIGSFLLLSVFATTSILHNRRKHEQYYFLDKSFNRVGQKISQLSKGGRTLFPGFILHDLARTHIAPLIFISKVPLVANYPFHQVWWYSEVVPKYYLERGLEGVEEYFDLMNADTLVVREPSWIQFMNDHRSFYRHRAKERQFLFYTRKKSSKDWFLEGDGEILDQSSSKIRLKLKSQSAVIKFNYFPFLEAEGCTLAPRSLPGDITFIEIKDCASTETPVTIKAGPVYKRVLNEIKNLVGW